MSTTPTIEERVRELFAAQAAAVVVLDEPFVPATELEDGDDNVVSLDRRRRNWRIPASIAAAAAITVGTVGYISTQSGSDKPSNSVMLSTPAGIDIRVDDPDFVGYTIDLPRGYKPGLNGDLPSPESDPAACLDWSLDGGQVVCHKVRGIALSYWNDGTRGLIFGAGTNADEGGLLESGDEAETHTVTVDGAEYTVNTSDSLLGVAWREGSSLLMLVSLGEVDERLGQDELIDIAKTAHASEAPEGEIGLVLAHVPAFDDGSSSIPAFDLVVMGTADAPCIRATPTLLNAECSPVSLADGSHITLLSDRWAGLVGMVSDDVDKITLDHDGETTTVEPLAIPGYPHRFVATFLDDISNTEYTLLDADGNEIDKGWVYAATNGNPGETVLTEGKIDGKRWYVSYVPATDESPDQFSVMLNGEFGGGSTTADTTSFDEDPTTFYELSGRNIFVMVTGPSVERVDMDGTPLEQIGQSATLGVNVFIVTVADDFERGVISGYDTGGSRLLLTELAWRGTDEKRLETDRADTYEATTKGESTPLPSEARGAHVTVASGTSNGYPWSVTVIGQTKAEAKDSSDIRLEIAGSESVSSDYGSAPWVNIPGAYTEHVNGDLLVVITAPSVERVELYGVAMQRGNAPAWFGSNVFTTTITGPGRVRGFDGAGTQLFDGALKYVDDGFGPAHYKVDHTPGPND